MNSRNMKNKFNSKIFKVMKSTSKTIFSHYLLSRSLMMSFEDLIFDILYLSISHDNRGHHENKNPT